MCKADLIGKFVVIKVYIRKGKMSKQYLTFYLKELGKEEQTKPQANRKKKIIKIRAEIK